MYLLLFIYDDYCYLLVNPNVDQQCWTNNTISSAAAKLQTQYVGVFTQSCFFLRLSNLFSFSC